MIIQFAPNLSLKLGKAEGEESLRHRHEDLAILGELGINSLCFVNAVDDEGEISAAHGLGSRYVGSHEFRLSDADTRMQDGVFQLGRNILRIRHLAMGHRHGDLPAQMLLVEAERLPAVPAIVNVGVKFHGRSLQLCRLLAGGETHRSQSEKDRSLELPETTREVPLEDRTWEKASRYQGTSSIPRSGPPTSRGR